MDRNGGCNKDHISKCGRTGRTCTQQYSITICSTFTYSSSSRLPVVSAIGFMPGLMVGLRMNCFTTTANNTVEILDVFSS
jgi:hypothetical protein